MGCLSIDHVRFQVGIQVRQLVSPFFKHRGCGCLSGMILFDNPSLVLSIKGKEGCNTGCVMNPPLPEPEPLMLLLIAYLAWSLELD